METVRKRIKLICLLLVVCTFCQGQSVKQNMKIELNKITLCNSDLQECINHYIPKIIQKCSLNKEKEVLCMKFLDKSPLLSFLPKSNVVGLTEWFFENNSDVIGYFKKDGVTIIVLGENAYKYSVKKKRKGKKVLWPIDYPPIIDGVYPYWLFSLEESPIKLLEESCPQERPATYF